MGNLNHVMPQLAMSQLASMTDARQNVGLSEEELERYSRQIALSELGRHKQERLRKSSVLIIGVGGLGSPAAMYLAAAGIGTIGLVDGDRVERSNLQCQPLYNDRNIGQPKVEQAAAFLRSLNPNTTVLSSEAHFNANTPLDFLRDYDVVIDGSDNFATHYAVNDACVAAHVAFVYASVSQFSGQVSVVVSGQSPCYRCLFDAPPPSGAVPDCAEGGVLGVLPGLLGTIQATEALKLILGIGSPLLGRLLLVDALDMRFRTVHVARNPACSACADISPPFSSPSPTLETRSMSNSDVPEITVHELNAMREQGEKPFVLDVRRPDEYDIANLDGALIPLDELGDRLSEIEEHRKDPALVVHCRSGARSAKAVALLRAHGFENAVNLKGGILAWSKEIDPSVPSY